MAPKMQAFCASSPVTPQQVQTLLDVSEPVLLEEQEQPESLPREPWGRGSGWRGRSMKQDKDSPTMKTDRRSEQTYTEGAKIEAYQNQTKPNQNPLDALSRRRYMWQLGITRG